MRPILLLSSVCAFLIVLNCVKSGIKCDKYGVNCDGIKGYQGHVSLFQPPTRHESGSAIQNSNLYKDGSDNFNNANATSMFKYTIVLSIDSAQSEQRWPG